jgi:NADP-dependent 3-hydroxy acid dehydrogenase YdfG
MIVLITGASSGFGEEMARKFVRRSSGHRCRPSAERLSALQQSWATIIAGYDGCDAKVFDSAMLADLPADWSQIDVLINNAGLALGTEPAIWPRRKRMGNHDRHQHQRSGDRDAGGSA